MTRKELVLGSSMRKFRFLAKVSTDYQQINQDDTIMNNEMIQKDPFEDKVNKVLNQVGVMLREKNRKYGNSALDPVRIFSKQSSIEGLKIRIDDKLSRIRNGASDEDEDPLNDLIGYLILYKIKIGESK